MKKLIPSLFLALTIAATASAQSARETSVKFNKNNENAVVAEYDSKADMVKEVLKERLDKEGLGKMKSSSGYMRYSGVTWNTVSSDKMDVYFKVESRKGKSMISVLLSKGYDNFVTSTSDGRAIDNVKAFLNSFDDEIVAYQKALDVKAQEEAVKKAEKKQQKIAEQQAKLEKENAAKQKALEEERRKLNSIKASVN